MTPRIFLLAVFALALACSSDTSGVAADTGAEEVEEIGLEPPPPPELVTETGRSDGTEFYSLRDALGLIATALDQGLPNLVDLTLYFGPLETVTVPATSAMPGTYELLLEIGCLACVDTAWSLKPARIHHPL